jgi:hypothetical protein
MGFDAQDKEIVRLLTKLKDADGNYPPDLLATRRDGYLRQMGEIGLVLAAGNGIKNAVKSTKPPVLSSATSTVLESALFVAIAAEAGTVAYFYRDKVADFFKSVTQETKVQEVSPSLVPTDVAVQGVSPSPAVAATLPSTSLAINPTEPESSSTPVPDVAEQNNALSVDATPSPKDHNNNGNHYGQTPKPERTKEPKGNDKDHNDKPPKDNPKPPKDNPKPTKPK